MALNREIIAFKANFPTFSDAKDADVAAVLNTASVMVKDDGTYTSSDYPLALNYYAAWLLSLVMEQSANVSIGGTGMSDIFVSSIRFGERTTHFQQRQSFGKIEQTAGPGEALLAANVWGQ